MQTPRRVLNESSVKCFSKWQSVATLRWGTQPPTPLIDPTLLQNGVLLLRCSGSSWLALWCLVSVLVWQCELLASWRHDGVEQPRRTYICAPQNSTWVSSSFGRGILVRIELLESRVHRARPFAGGETPTAANRGEQPDNVAMKTNADYKALQL